MPNEEDQFAEFFRDDDDDEGSEAVVAPGMHLGLGASYEGEVEAVLNRALIDIPRVCPECQIVCGEHAVKLRDAMLQRGHSLASQFVNLTALYSHMRSMDIRRCDDLLNKTYEVWQELSILFQVTEPEEDGSTG